MKLTKKQLRNIIREEAKRMVNENTSTYFKDREIENQIMLTAENDGDAYRAGDPEIAVERAYRDFKNRVIEDIDYWFDRNKRDLVRDLGSEWAATEQSLGTGRERGRY